LWNLNHLINISDKDINKCVKKFVNMIVKQTKVKIIDNSGALYGQCIHVYGKKWATIGDEILVAVKKVKSKKVDSKNAMKLSSSASRRIENKVKKGSVMRAIVVWVKKAYKMDNGNLISFDENAVVLLKSRGGDPVGTRVLGVIPRYLGYLKDIQSKASYKKIISLTKMSI
jgi:large subunit ribosomal protein L14